jgi:hypothetical protein
VVSGPGAKSGNGGADDDLEKHCDGDDAVGEVIAEAGPALAGHDRFVDADVVGCQLGLCRWWRLLLLTKDGSGWFGGLWGWNAERAAKGVEGGDAVLGWRVRVWGGNGLDFDDCIAALLVVVAGVAVALVEGWGRGRWVVMPR